MVNYGAIEGKTSRLLFNITERNLFAYYLSVKVTQNFLGDIVFDSTRVLRAEGRTEDNSDAERQKA